MHARGGRSRRNVVTAGVALSSRQGLRFRIGVAQFRAVIPCQSCAHLGRKTQPGTLAALIGRCGSRAEVIEDGIILAGDVIQFL